MKHTYSTSQTAEIIGIHPNTVRLYEELGLITPPERKSNGYRIFTDLHIRQFRIARLAFQVEVLQNGLRKQAVDIIKTTAQCDFSGAIALSEKYLKQVSLEKERAEEAIRIARDLIEEKNTASDTLSLTRKETADYLGVSIDTLRNWELNGLLEVKRKRNGYRIYTEEDIRRLKIIRSLRCADYSLTAILRMLRTLTVNPAADIRTVIDTPKEQEDIFSACDSLLSSLSHARKNFLQILEELEALKKEQENNPPL